MELLLIALIVYAWFRSRYRKQRRVKPGLELLSSESRLIALSISCYKNP